MSRLFFTFDEYVGVLLIISALFRQVYSVQVQEELVVNVGELNDQCT